MNEIRSKLLAYIPIANYIAEMNGPNSESLIHDISDYNHSIIYITPRNITGRKVGGPLTDYAIQLLNNKTYEQTDYVVNYIGRSSHNNLILRSSTYFIKDNGRLIGLLCTNIDITDQIRATEILRESLLVNLDYLNQDRALETFSLSSDELINKVFAKVVGSKGSRKLTLEEKHKIIAELDAMDIFMVRGTISTVAELMNVSEKTVYRYIKQIKDERRNDA